MLIDDPNGQIVKPGEMLTDEQRSHQEKGRVRPLLNGVWADRLENGQDLAVGGSFIDSNLEIKLQLDFDTFEPKLVQLTPESLQTRYEQIKDRLIEWLESAEQITGRKINMDPYDFYRIQQVQAVVLALLDHNPDNHSTGFDRRQAYNNPDVKLSELVGKSHCAELAALGQYALQKTGITSSYVGGISMVDPNDDHEYAEAHSFIVLKDEDGKEKYIFDIARPQQQNLPRIMEPKQNFDYDLLEGTDEKLVEAEEILTGSKSYFGVGEQVAGHHNVIN